jgi:hypothetical protein
VLKIRRRTPHGYRYSHPFRDTEDLTRARNLSAQLVPKVRQIVPYQHHDGAYNLFTNKGLNRDFNLKAPHPLG